MKGVFMNKISIGILLAIMISVLNAYSFGQNKVQPKKINWKIVETKHFDIHYSEEDDQFGKTIAFIAENAYYHLNYYFKTPVIKRIPIIVYQSKQQFQTSNIIYPLLSEGVGGFTESLRNRVVVPFDGSFKKFEEVLVHELTHAYINDISGNIMMNPLFERSNTSLPFWFSEGLPEYLSIGGEDVYNNMFILDLVLNDKLYPLDQIYGYYAYRLGEAFLTWLSVEYGDEVPAKFFYQIRVSPDLDTACKKLFGQKFDEVEKRFRMYLKRKYYPIIQNYSTPTEYAERLTDYSKFKANMNVSPRLSPLGDKIVFFSNKMSRTGIWEINTFGEKKKARQLLKGEVDGRFEEFHFQRSNIAFMPSGDEIVFVSKTTRGDVIYTYNITKKKVVSTLFLKEMDAIYELDVSPDGKTIVFSGQKNNQNNIYLYDIERKRLDQITYDSYQDSQPKWSNDGKKIAFVSERTFLDQSKYQHIFSKLNKNIFIYDTETSQFSQVSYDQYNNHSPEWTSDDSAILCISEEDRLSNIIKIDLKTAQKAHLVKFFSGVLDFDLSKDDDVLTFSCFNDGAWDIYLMNKPLNELQYQEYEPVKSLVLTDDFADRFKIDHYRYFGKNPNDSVMVITDSKEKRRFRPGQPVERDSLVSIRMKELDRITKIEEKPDSSSFFEPVFKKYQPRLMIDQFWGGMAYSSSLGTIGQIQLGMSDLMGNHALGINTEFNGKLKDSNFTFSYLYLPHRIDYGLAVFKTSDDLIFRDSTYFKRLTERELGAYFLLRYPLNRYFRLEVDQSVYEYQRDIDLWNPATSVEEDGFWTNETLDKYWTYSPSISLVYDNALYGQSGPMTGIKAFYTLKTNISEGDYDYITNYTDFRTYWALSERFAIAHRLILGHSNGNSPQQFHLEGFNGVRGNSSDREGDTKILNSMELRVPLIDYLKLGFPLPIVLGDIRGSIFADFGTVWNLGDDYQGINKGRTKDLVFGFGYGPRMNIGYFVLKLDIAWNSDFVNHGKPIYYFSINQDF